MLVISVDMKLLSCLTVRKLLVLSVITVIFASGIAAGTTTGTTDDIGVGVEMDSQSEVEVGEEVDFSPEIEIIDLNDDTILDQPTNSELTDAYTLTVDLYVNDEEVDSQTFDVEIGDTETPNFNHTFEQEGEQPVRIEAGLTLFSQEIAEAEESIEISVSSIGNLETEFTDQPEPVVNEEVAFKPAFEVPDIQNNRDESELDAKLYVDGEEVVSTETAAEDGDTATPVLNHTFGESGEKEVTIEGSMSFGDIEITGNETTTVDVAPFANETSAEGAAFAAPESIEDDLDDIRDDVPVDIGVYAFVLATQDDLHLVFTDEEPREGYASVNGFAVEELPIDVNQQPAQENQLSVETENLTFSVITTTDTDFQEHGKTTTVESIYDDPGSYDLNYVNVSAHHQQLAVRTKYDDLPSYSTTVGLLREDPAPPEDLVDSVGERSHDLLQDPTSDDVNEFINETTDPHLMTSSFRTSLWTNANATIDGIVLGPETPAQEFVDAFDMDGLATETNASTLYVVDEEYPTQEVDNVSAITEQANELNGDTVSVEANLSMGTISARETVISPPCENGIPTQGGCVPIFHDTVLHGGVAWNAVPDDSDDLLMMVGASSWDQDDPLEAHAGEYRLTGEVVSTNRIDESLPDGAILLTYDLEEITDELNIGDDIENTVENASDEVLTQLEKQVEIDDDGPVAGSPELLNTSPAANATLDADTETVDVELDYDGNESSIDTAAVELAIDGENVTDNPNTTISNNNLTYTNFAVDDGESYDVSVFLADEDGNTISSEFTFSIATKDSSPEPPTLVNTSPTENATLDAETETVDVELNYSSNESSINTTAVELAIDGENVTDDPNTTIANNSATYTNLTVDSGETYRINVSFADIKGNDILTEYTFSVAADDSDNGGGGGGAPVPGPGPGPGNDDDTEDEDDPAGEDLDAATEGNESGDDDGSVYDHDDSADEDTDTATENDGTDEGNETSETDEQGDNEDDIGNDSVPGFGPLTAIAALLLAPLMLARHHE